VYALNSAATGIGINIVLSAVQNSAPYRVTAIPPENHCA